MKPTPPSPARPRSIFLGLLLASLTLLAACSDSRREPGFIRAPDFVDESGRLAPAWQFAHHATSDSYTLSVVDGTASIERVGREPWARLSQLIDREAVPEVAGRRVQFAVDLRAELDDSRFGKPIEPSGLMVRFWQKPAGGESMLNAMIGGPRSKSERLELAADARIADWQRHSVELVLPEDVTRLEVSAILATGGRLELRNPSLHVIDE